MKAKKKIPMTGTPIENRVKDLYPLLNWIAPEQFDSVGSFLNTYDDGNGAPKNPKKFQAMLLPYMFRRRKREVLKDLPAIQRSIHLVDMPDIHKTRYKEALNFFFLKWDGSKKDINSTLAQLTRLRQVIADAKADATVEWVQDFLEQTTEKLIIFSYYVAPVRQLAAELGCDAIYGDVDPAKRMQMVDAFNNDPSVRVLVIQANTGQTGLNLTAANNVYFNDISWSFTDIEQGEARAHGRLNDLHGANSVRAVVDGTIDKLLSDVIEYKSSISDSAIDGTNEYAGEQVSIMNNFLDKLNDMRGGF
jgi:SWI/SNF-related matrix-associated actin-dependent regulator 1 of chromatin subfamily A